MRSLYFCLVKQGMEDAHQQTRTITHVAFVCVCAKDLDTGEKSRVAQLQEDQKEDFQRNEKKDVVSHNVVSFRMRLDTFSRHFMLIEQDRENLSNLRKAVPLIGRHGVIWSVRLDV